MFGMNIFYLIECLNFKLFLVWVRASQGHPVYIEKGAREPNPKKDPRCFSQNNMANGLFKDYLLIGSYPIAGFIKI